MHWWVFAQLDTTMFTTIYEMLVSYELENCVRAVSTRGETTVYGWPVKITHKPSINRR